MNYLQRKKQAFMSIIINQIGNETNSNEANEEMDNGENTEGE